VTKPRFGVGVREKGRRHGAVGQKVWGRRYGAEGMGQKVSGRGQESRGAIS